MQFLLSSLPVLCAVAVPFINVVRGRSAFKALLLGWVLILVSFAVFTLVIPLILFRVNHDLSHEWSSFYPQPAIVVGMIFFGWFYAGIPVLIGMGIRKCVTSAKTRNHLSGGEPREKPIH